MAATLHAPRLRPARRVAPGPRPRPREPERLAPLDAAFHALESARAPMHLGWAAEFQPPAGAPAPRFEEIRSHIESRLGRAPRYRQRLVHVPFGLADPVWIDDETFDLARHVRRSTSTDLGRLADQVMSAPLDPNRPLWELWISERLDNGRIGIVGKAHHALVDGLAAVELMALLRDPTPEVVRDTPEPWAPASAPGPNRLVRAALRERRRRAAALGRSSLGLALHPRAWWEHARQAMSAGRVIGRAAMPLAPASRLNTPLSAGRHLAWESRPLDDLKTVERHFGVTMNDVFLAAAAGSLRELRLAGREARSLKAMVPVSIRTPEDHWGNRIAFLFPGLPLHEPDPVGRLTAVHREMASWKASGRPEAADAVIRTLASAPRLVRALASRVLTSRRLSNLTISNVPGPPVPLYLMGSRAVRAYPVVPLTGGHGISIGMTSVDGAACFGVYADGERTREADRLAHGIARQIDALVALCAGESGRLAA